MLKSTLAAASLLAPVLIAAPAQAQAQQSVRATVETQDFSDNFGSLRTATLEYKAVLPDTTVVVTPTYGERRADGARATAVGLGAAVYRDWSDRVSTRTEGFVAEDKPVFANLDFAQDVSVKVFDKTVVTLGGRWARYHGDQEVTFLSAGARRYFKGGSVAYRLTRVDPYSGEAFLSHLVSVTVNDGQGQGKTQLWLATGAASLERAQLEYGFTGQDRSALVQRTQPLGDRLAIIGSAGISSYARTGGHIHATTFALGLQLGLQ